eukprot:scaffold59725_cov18-Phaeocystis_antarctica.AAC.1
MEGVDRCGHLLPRGPPPRRVSRRAPLRVSRVGRGARLVLCGGTPREHSCEVGARRGIQTRGSGGGGGGGGGVG